MYHCAAYSVLLRHVQEARRHENQIGRLSLTSKDCTNLMPGEPPDDQARIKALTEESKVLEEELIEVEAKNRLYSLLGERTRSATRTRVLPQKRRANLLQPAWVWRRRHQHVVTC